MEYGRFTITELSSHFPQIFHSLLQKSVVQNCAPGGCQSNWHQNTKQSAWSQHGHFCSSTMMTARSFWTGSWQVMNRKFHTLPQKQSSSQCIGVTVDLRISRPSRRGKWCARCSGSNGTFSFSTSWPEVRRWMLSVTAKSWENCDGPFRTSGAECLVPVFSCCRITLGHTRLDKWHTPSPRIEIKISDSSGNRICAVRLEGRDYTDQVTATDYFNLNT